MTAFETALTLEASYHVWCARARHGGSPAWREVWAEASPDVRCRQAERWLRLEARRATPKRSASRRPRNRPVP